MTVSANCEIELQGHRLAGLNIGHRVDRLKAFEQCRDAVFARRQSGDDEGAVPFREHVGHAVRSAEDNDLHAAERNGAALSRHLALHDAGRRRVLLSNQRTRGARTKERDESV